MLPQKILVIEPQLLQTGAGHVGQLEFGLFGGATGLAAFGNVLHPAARRLDHLVVGPAFPVDVAVAKTHGHVINKLGQLKALEPPVAPVGGNDTPA